jgi:hypothetical protein
MLDQPSDLSFLHDFARQFHQRSAAKLCGLGVEVSLDPAQGRALDGLLKTLDGWTDSTFHVVPARGKVTTGTTVKAFRDI